MAKVTIKAVGFDLGGVILTSEQQHFYELAQAALGVPIEEVYTAVAHYMPPLERGDILIEEFWQKVCRELGVSFDPKFIRLWSDHYVQDSPINRRLLKLSDRLRANGYKTGILSNTHAEHVRLNLGRRIFEHFTVALMSNEICARKPEPEAFFTLCRALGVKPDQLIFIDDLQVNVEGAAKLGIKSIKFTGNDKLLNQLGELGVEI